VWFEREEAGNAKQRVFHGRAFFEEETRSHLLLLSEVAYVRTVKF
jgi:hypothetical protein